MKQKEFIDSFVADMLEKPFGSLTKKELEIVFLKNAIEYNILPQKPHELALKLKITIAKAHAYLTEIALRKKPLEDYEALKALAETIITHENCINENFIVIPIENADLRIWLERDNNIFLYLGHIRKE